jgi:hypothetical protein
MSFVNAISRRTVDAAVQVQIIETSGEVFGAAVATDALNECIRNAHTLSPSTDEVMLTAKSLLLDQVTVALKVLDQLPQTPGALLDAIRFLS